MYIIYNTYNIYTKLRNEYVLEENQKHIFFYKHFDVFRAYIYIYIYIQIDRYNFIVCDRCRHQKIAYFFHTDIFRNCIPSSVYVCV